MRRLDPADPPAIGGYPLLARLGAGGMGQVFLSRTTSGRPLALKTVRTEFGLNPGFEQRFAREIASSDQVRSPWTVSVVDYSPAGHRPQWLATEYVAAPSLADWMASYGPLPESAVRALAAELAEGLRAVHRAGLAHRDVKPSNVLLARRHPLLIDFGIARAADDTRHTHTGGVIGSPGYMAPEQVTGGISAEPGDIFSLGAVLVYAVTGTGPFLHPGEDPSAAQLLYRIVHEEPVLDGVPQPLASLLAACLEKSPQARPTADALLERLEARSGVWASARPSGLEADIAARETELAALLEHPAPLLPEAQLAPDPAPQSGFGPPTAYGSPITYGSPPALPSSPTPGPVLHLTPSAAGAAPGRPSVRAWTAAVTAGAVVTAAVITALAWPDGTDDAAGGNGRTTPPASASPSPTAAENALPSSWVGTWKGTGPGSPAGDGIVNARTNRVAVTVTLHAANRGEIVGRQISHVTEDGTGRDLGCTETLRLRETHGTSMVFEAVTSAPTDPSAGVLCSRGNLYTLAKTGANTLTLGNEGSQTTGSPSRLTRSS
ncbi:Serine/threonine protein kinase [Streptomyces sp. cf386]|uniref:serine/threonine-protein kinase n=1 Tax=Streptomyces sp. cf386 TaxID=1761904 RepID=UPI00087E6649|nr:serine/threonine-protein kinase [Streptomyces sp. cf386]SDP72856.1 Serine/threonine protein kinase [Streptomyces sp. cf386]